VRLYKRLGWTRCAVVLGAGLLVPAEAAAQSFDSEVRIDQFQPASAFSPFGRAEGPHREFDEGIEFGFRLDTDYALTPLKARVMTGDTENTDMSTTPVEHALLLHLGGAISPLYWMAFDLDMPFAVFETGEGNVVSTAPNGTDLYNVNGQKADPGTAGVGDLRIGALLRPVTTDVVDVALGVRVFAPWGSEKAKLAGPNHWARFELVGSVAGKDDIFSYGCTAALAPLFFAGRDGDRAALSCAGLFDITPEFSVAVEPHAALFTYPPHDRKDSHAPGWDAGANGEGTHVAVQIEPMASLRLHFGPFSVALAGGPGFGGAPGTAAARGVLSLAYTAIQEPVIEAPPPPDFDLDGIPDAYDACPKQAGPKERRGCPENLDVDGDGIIDGDACPNEPGPRTDNPKTNGCPDSDNDSYPDPVDKCPHEPGAKTGGCPKFSRLMGLDGASPVRFKITPPIKFTKGSSELPPDAISAIKEIVATMRANPKLHQVSFAVGAKKAGQDLTDKRAGAILKILAEDQDFDSNRYEVVLSDDQESGAVTVRLVQ
jgi:hypothetical protein